MSWDNEGRDVEEGKSPSSGQAKVWRAWEPLAAVTCYALCSISLNLANKAVFSDQSFHFPWTTLAIQNIITVTLLLITAIILRASGYEIPLRCSPQLIQELLKPSIGSTMFLVSNAYALRYMSIPMLTVFKSFAPLGVTLCEVILTGHSMSRPMLLALLLIVTSNIVTMTNDIDASFLGYFWAMISVAANILQVYSLGASLSKRWMTIEKTIWGNILSTLMILPATVYFGEVQRFPAAFRAVSTPFKTLYFTSGAMACLISFSMYWATSVNRGSTVSFTGAITKLPLVLLGYALFDTKISFYGWLGILVALSASMLYAYVKAREKHCEDFSAVEEQEN
eukprot:CAMPEP_0198731850 /NCGR_PEP_ID=MMETSP1475-20131203/32502_1 /TAXON_ID= ORGANISM="Unidentified sp., Strain CCMP1999" /NCGR_SAMPLE_ID=MMETSP1475 /ASSEMBLY_ACC=CAM_ASM_001111 /LENGTH=337 /DNA_ID=CAMNT_0044494865 /DNA_START=48 /DNA_END=1061 /DNA_ORIENTATION=+